MLAGCGEPVPPFVGEWVVDAGSSAAANPRTSQVTSLLRRLAEARVTIDDETMVTRFGDFADTKAFDLVARDGDTFKLEGRKGGVMIVKVMGKDRISIRDSSDITLVLDRKKG